MDVSEVSTPRTPFSPLIPEHFFDTPRSYAKQSHVPDLQNIEEWVKWKVAQLSLDVSEREQPIIDMRTLKLPRGTVSIAPSFNVEMRDLYRYNIPGGGTCLIHSFLATLSETFRKLSPSDKVIVGENYREEIAKLPIFTEEQRTTLMTKSQGGGNYVPLDASPFADIISDFLDVGLLIISSDSYKCDEAKYFEHIGKPLVIIIGSGGHYDALSLDVEPDNKQQFLQSIELLHYKTPDSGQSEQKLQNEYMSNKEILLETYGDVENIKSAFVAMGFMTSEDVEAYKQDEDFLPVAVEYAKLYGMLGGGKIRNKTRRLLRQTNNFVGRKITRRLRRKTSTRKKARRLRRKTSRHR
jgi:hypothetical protein